MELGGGISTGTGLGGGGGAAFNSALAALSFLSAATVFGPAQALQLL